MMNSKTDDVLLQEMNQDYTGLWNNILKRKTAEAYEQTGVQ